MSPLPETPAQDFCERKLAQPDYGSHPASGFASGKSDKFRRRGQYRKAPPVLSWTGYYGLAALQGALMPVFTSLTALTGMLPAEWPANV